jgi:vacuolar-type H+-ATPase subunit F/Vma7
MTESRSFLAIAPWGQDIGFNLGGAPVVTVYDEDSLNAALDKILDEDTTGILAVPRPMIDWLSARNRRTLRRRLFPVVVYYSYPEEWEEPSALEETVSLLVERAIGYRLRIKL